jgi:hypothetical protein
LVKDSFLTQPVTATITCATCGETLFFHDTQCRFCRTAVDRDAALRSFVTRGFVTAATRSANIIRSFRPLVYITVALALMGLFSSAPTMVTTALIISFLNIVGPIRWLRKYRGIALVDFADADVVRAHKEMRRELLLWGGAILAEGVMFMVASLKR